MIVPFLFVDETRLVTVSSGHGWRHTTSFPEHDGSSHTPLAPSPELSQKPRWVGLGRTISDRSVDQSAVCSDNILKSAILRWKSGDRHALSASAWASSH